jgi:LPXTG-motif cell wall-anchored protein
MSNCDTSWSGKAFTNADFSFPVMNFGAISLDSTKWYTVVFAGDAVAGTLPSGVTAPVATAAPSVPGTPTATAGNAQATVQITAPTSGGTPTSYTVTATPGGATCSITAPATSCTVTGLTNGTAYTFSSTATNAGGTSAASANSSAVTPSAPAAKLATTGANLEWLLVAGLFAVVAGSGFLAFSRRKRIW